MIDFSQFTLNNQGLMDLNKVLFTTAFKESNLADICTMQNGIKDGEKLDYVDNMGEVGTAGRGCDPTYTSVDIKGLEKAWSLGDWSIPKKICYKTLENTIAKWSLNTGISKDDLTNTDFWNKIMLPLLDKALTEFYWRVAWFGDTAAKNVAQTNGGNITAGVDVDLFKITDGFWKRLFTIAGSNASKRTAIAANTEASEGAQKTAIKTQGVALGILDNLLADADSRIQANGGVLMMTNSLYQAFRRDYAKAYKDTIPFMEVAEGVKLPHYDGVPVRPVLEWDNLIKKYEDNETKLNNPHRAVFTAPTNLFVGTSAASHLADFDIIFDKVTRNNYMYAASDIGTLVGEDDLVQVAY